MMLDRHMVHSCITYPGLRWHCQGRLGTCWCYLLLSVESPLLLLHWHAHCSSTCTQLKDKRIIATLWHTCDILRGLHVKKQIPSKFLHGKLTLNSTSCVFFHSPPSQVDQVDLADSLARKVRWVGSLKDHHTVHRRITLASVPGLRHLQYLIAFSV